MSGHTLPRPARTKLLSPGVWVLLLLMAVGGCSTAYRFVFGIEAVSNLDQQHPWGIWVAIDVATGVALAAGGFTTAALVYIFHREHYHVLVRPALLTAMLGYTFVSLGLMVDLGRFYNIWHPMVYWQGNSVLFEVGCCVMCYTNVLYIEFMPIICERFLGDTRFPRLRRLCTMLHGALGRIMFLFIIAGVVLSCLHQSALGNLMLIAPYKTHPLWSTPILSLLFLLSAVAVGFPMVIFESMYASWSLGHKPEAHVLCPLAKSIPVLLGVYMAFKFGDMLIRESYVYLAEGSVQSTMFIIEVVFGLIVPFVMLLSEKMRSSPRCLFLACLLIVLGVAVNRINVFLVSYSPPYASRAYSPSFAEAAITVGLVATLIFIYRVIVTYLPVISHPSQGAGHELVSA